MMPRVPPIVLVLALGVGFAGFVFASAFLTLGPSLLVGLCVGVGFLLLRLLAYRRMRLQPEETEK